MINVCMYVHSVLFVCVADITSRFSLEQAIHHTFLTTGTGSVSMDPLLLHTLPAVPLPLPSEGSASGVSGADGDKDWARRQCSMVWAPMPTDYSFSSDATAGEEEEEETSVTSVHGGGGGGNWKGRGRRQVSLSSPANLLVFTLLLSLLLLSSSLLSPS